MLLVKENYLLSLLFSLLIVFTSSSFSFSKTNIYEIKNEIYVLDIHGKRFILDKSNQIKTGDYLKTRKKPATIILGNKTKICMSPNSALKINFVNLVDKHYEISFDFKKGDLNLQVSENSSDKHIFNFFSYNLKSFSNELILSKNKELKLINYQNKLKLFFKDKLTSIILPYSFSRLSDDGKIIQTTNIPSIDKLRNKFTKGCASKISNKRQKNYDAQLQYGCITQNGKLVCGNRYK